MTRSIVSGLLGLLSVIVVGSVPLACQSGGVGDPCTPEDEYDARFAGFKVTEENIESRSFQCQTRICLVNHFQGRVSCPLGQGAPAVCGVQGAPACASGECVRSATFAPECETNEDCGNIGNGICNETGKYCECNPNPTPPATDGCPEEVDGTGLRRWACNTDANLGPVNQCLSFVCNSANGCQKAGDDPADNTGKGCCIPGTDVPVASSVCGQCGPGSTRSVDQAVYCSCRCGVADGEKEDSDFNFCDCPDGFQCKEIRKNVGLGDEQITGKYCIKENTLYVNESQCGEVPGYYDSTQCKGIPTAL